MLAAHVLCKTLLSSRHVTSPHACRYLTVSRSREFFEHPDIVAFPPILILALPHTPLGFSLPIAHHGVSLHLKFTALSKSLLSVPDFGHQGAATRQARNFGYWGVAPVPRSSKHSTSAQNTKSVTECMVIAILKVQFLGDMERWLRGNNLSIHFRSHIPLSNTN
jgi:hypothetical protein